MSDISEDSSRERNELQTDSLPIDERSQSLNIAIYVASNWLLYLAAPVLYVGITQAALCHELGASAAIANLPSSASFWMTVIPLLIVWRLPRLRVRAALMSCFMVCALASLLVTASLLLNLTNEARIATVILSGAMIGGSQATLAVFFWDMLNVGVDSRRRGVAFSLAFGIGPLFAVAGSLATQNLLAEAFHFPTNFVLVFLASVPILALGALLSAFYQIPKNAECHRDELRISDARHGIREIVRDRILLVTVVAFLAISAGDTIVNNMSLYYAQLMGESPDKFAGAQQAIRFGFKSVVGLALGWLLVKTHAKTGALVTSGFGVLGILWIFTMPKNWSLYAFGFMGAADLYAIYYSNYFVSRSRPESVRMNMALLSLATMLSSFAPAMFGAVSDRFGFPASFTIAAALIGTSFLLVLFYLPAKVSPVSVLAEAEYSDPATRSASAHNSESQATL